MKLMLAPRSLTLLMGISVCGISGYLLYKYLIKEDEDEDDFFVRPAPKRSDYRTMDISIPTVMVKELIGKNGSVIKSIEQRTNTRINFKEISTDKPSTCVVRGSRQSCELAENIIQDFINSQNALECCDMWIPRYDVGKIIGKMGKKVIEIQSVSGAKINVDRNETNDGAATRRVMLRGTKEQIALAKSLIEEALQNDLQNKSQVDSILAKREPRGPVKSPSPKLIVDTSPKVERISPIPGQTDAQFEVYISAMVDPSHFWLQIVGVKATELDQLVEEMTDFYSEVENRDGLVLNEVKPGDLVASTFSFDNKWYRAEVLGIFGDNPDDPQVELFYADYGDTDVVPSSEVYELRTDFLRLPFQAIECFLARVDPIGDQWTDQACNRFEDLTHVAQWKKLSARINGYCTKEKTRAKREGSPVPGMDLFDVVDDRDIDIAQELVNEGFAVFRKDAELKSSSSRGTSNSSVNLI